MCYSYKVVWTQDKAKHFQVNPKNFAELSKRGQIQKRDGEYIFFPKDQVPVVLEGKSGQPLITSMYWDLLPRDFTGTLDHVRTQQVDLLSGVEPTLSEVLASKKFHTYNARVETISQKKTYEGAWSRRQRCLIPVDSFWERPNMEEAPKELKGRVFEVEFLQERALAGIYDVWEGLEYKSSGEVRPVKFPSVSVITASGIEHPVMQKVYHNRVPLVVAPNEYKSWISKDLSSDEAISHLEALHSCANLDVLELKLEQM